MERQAPSCVTLRLMNSLLANEAAEYKSGSKLHLLSDSYFLWRAVTSCAIWRSIFSSSFRSFATWPYRSEVRIKASQKNQRANEFQSRFFFLPLRTYAITKGISAAPIVPPKTEGSSQKSRLPAAVKADSQHQAIANATRNQDHALIAGAGVGCAEDSAMAFPFHAELRRNSVQHRVCGRGVSTLSCPWEWARLFN